MPITKKINKTPCSLCHQVVEELKYHYDICEPCHQNGDVFQREHQTDDESDVDYSEEEDDYLTDSDMEDELPLSSAELEREVRSMYADQENNITDDIDEKKQ